jgi:hypothetical protein
VSLKEARQARSNPQIAELIVPGPHGSFALPQTIAELKRILRLDLAASSHASLNRTKVP